MVYTFFKHPFFTSSSLFALLISDCTGSGKASLPILSESLLPALVANAWLMDCRMGNVQFLMPHEQQYFLVQTCMLRLLLLYRAL